MCFKTAKVEKKLEESNKVIDPQGRVSKNMNWGIRVNASKSIAATMEAVLKINNFLTAKDARITQRAQYIDNQNYNITILRPLR